MKKEKIKKETKSLKKNKKSDLIDGSPTPMSSSRLRDLFPSAINLDKENPKQKD